MNAFDSAQRELEQLEADHPSDPFSTYLRLTMYLRNNQVENGLSFSGPSLL